MTVQISADTLAALAVLITWWKTPKPSNQVPQPGALNYPTVLLLKAYAVVDGLEPAVGFGPPCEGEDLKVGSGQFVALQDQLRSAIPNNNWQGSAAQDYAHAVETLQDDMQTLAEMDRKLAALVKDQAAWVSHMSLGFSLVKFLLAVAISVTTLAAVRSFRLAGFGMSGFYWAKMIRAAKLCAYVAVTLAAGMVAGLTGVAEDKVH